MPAIMNSFIKENIKWIDDFFKKTKWLFETLGIFILLETFLYQFPEDFAGTFSKASLLALQIVFWVFILIITFLLYARSEIEIISEEQIIFTSIHKGTILSKFILRSLLLVIFIIIGESLFNLLKHDFKFIHLITVLVIVFILILIELIRFLHKKRNGFSTRT